MSFEKITSNDGEQEVPNKSMIGKIKNAVALGAAATVGFVASEKLHSSGHDSVPSQPKISEEVKSSPEDAEARVSIRKNLDMLKNEGIEALHEPTAEKYVAFIGKIGTYVGALRLERVANSPGQSKYVAGALEELYQMVGVAERGLTGVVHLMEVNRGNLVRSQATVTGGSFDLSAADLKSAGQMILAQRDNEISSTRQVLTDTVSSLKLDISSQYKGLTGHDLK